LGEYEEKSLQVIRVMFVLDVVLTVCTFLFAYWIKGVFVPEIDIDFFSHLALLPFILFLMIFGLSYFGAYRSFRVATTAAFIWSVFRAVAGSMALLLTLLYLFRIQYVSRMVIVVFAVLIFVVLAIERTLFVEYFKRSIKQGRNFLKVLIIGTGDRAKSLSEGLRRESEWGIDIIGHLDPEGSRVGMKILGAPVLGTVDKISDVLRDNVVDEVILAIPRRMIEDVEEIGHACEEEGVKLRMMADVFDLKLARMQLVQLGRIPLLTLEPVAHDETKLLIKRAIDLVITCLILPFLLPIMGIIAIAIKFDSPGPVLFVQQRVGFNGKPFRIFKFRSMVVDAEQRMKEVERLNEAEGPIFKITNDPRVTRVGRFLRRTSLDELPQLFNVLRGEMSIVGPRPMSLRDVNLFDRGIQRKRFSVKPGLTCLWQVSGRSNLPFSKWLELDLEYIENWSLFLDFKIMLKTIPAVLSGGGAV